MRWFRILSLSLVLVIVGTGVIIPSIAISGEEALVIGIFPRRNTDVTIKIFTPMSEYLSQQLGREVRLVTTKDFKTFWEGMMKQQYDIVHYNQYHYVKTHKELGYEAILKNEEFGRPTITGSLVVRKDSGIHSIQDLRGKKIVFGGGPKAMPCYVFATYLLRKGGLQKGDYIEELAINPPNAIMAAYFGQAAAGGVGDAVLGLPILTQKIDTSKLTFLARGKQRAHLPWAVKGSMRSELRDKIQSVLSGLKDTPEGQEILKKAKLTGLQIAIDDEYDPHREIIRELLGEDY